MGGQSKKRDEIPPFEPAIPSLMASFPIFQRHCGTLQGIVAATAVEGFGHQLHPQGPRHPRCREATAIHHCLRL